MVKRLVMTSLLAAALAGPSFAQPEAQSDVQMGPGRRLMQERNVMMDKLNLNEQQQSQMEKFRLEMQKKQITLQSKIGLLRLDLKEIFLGDNPEKSAVEKKMKEISDLQHQEKVAFVDHLFAVKSILSAEQQKIWKKHMLKVGMEFQERIMDRKVRIIERQGNVGQRQGRDMQWQDRDGKEIEVEVER